MKEDIDTEMDTSEDLVDVSCNGVEGRYAKYQHRIICMCSKCLGANFYKPKKWVYHVCGYGYGRDS